MWHAILTILVFIGWGLTWGTVLGGLSGTLIYPYFGTIYALAWGAGMGGIMGGVTGVLAVISDRLFRREKMNLQSYRRKLAVTFGTITSIGVVMLLISSTRGFLWGPGGMGLQIYLALSLIAGIFWGWLGAAYTAARHADANISDALRGDRIDSTTVIARFMRGTFKPATFLAATLAGIAFYLYSRNTSFAAPTHTIPMQIRFIIEGGILGILIALADIILLGLANGFLLLFVNRLYVKEYAPHLTLAQYKTRMSVLVFLFTLFAGLLVSGFVFAPVSALIAVVAARSYADWLYDGAEKFKGKPKASYAHLEDSDDEPEDMALLEAETSQRAAQKA